MSRWNHGERDEREVEAIAMARSSTDDTTPEPSASQTDHADRSARSVGDLGRDAAGLRGARSDERKPMASRDRSYRLREAETELLATIGTFRVVPAAELSGDIRHLVAERLIEQHEVTINERATAVCVLTHEGKALLETQRPSSEARSSHRRTTPAW